MPRYFYQVTKTSMWIRRDENDPEAGPHNPFRLATADELQPEQPSTDYRLFSTHADKGLNEIIFVWEMVDTSRDEPKG